MKSLTSNQKPWVITNKPPGYNSNYIWEHDPVHELKQINKTAAENLEREKGIRIVNNLKKYQNATKREVMEIKADKVLVAKLTKAIQVAYSSNIKLGSCPVIEKNRPPTPR